MKKINTLLAASVFAATAGVSAPVMADLSANAGFVSDYYYRGQSLGDAGLYAGVDYETGGFYAGVWVIDDGGTGEEGGNDGLETDFYVGYGIDLGGVSVSIGYTAYEYTYTGDSEDEINLGVGYGAFSFDYADGTAEADGAEADYIFYSLGWSGEVFAATYGHGESDESGDDSQYDYFELSASGEISGLDVTATIGKTTNVEDAAGNGDDSGDGYMVLDISKSFDL